MDFFGDCIALVDHFARGAQCGHPLLEFVIGHRHQERESTRKDFSLKLGRSALITCVMI
jgi:hypothetical protein